MAKVTLTIEVEYDPEATDPDSIATALDRLMETALSSPGILDEYGDVNVGEFFPPQISSQETSDDAIDSV